MATHPPLFAAVSPSARQLLILLRCISFSKKAQVRISSQGLRFAAEEGSVMEASVFLDKALFTSYAFNPPPPVSSQDDAPGLPVFEISLISLLETLNIFSLSDPSATKRPGEYDAFAAHRLNRHAAVDAFSTRALGTTGTCSFGYLGEGSPLSVHMNEVGVTTTCDLTTYEADSMDDIPFNRDALSLKAIMRSSYLLDAVTELSSLNPTTVAILASPTARSHLDLTLSATGSLGSAAVDFTTATDSDAPILETFQCAAPTSASFSFGAIKAAQRAMATATKASLRLDEAGVLSLQFLVEVEPGSAGGEAIAFVDFKAVPLIEGEGDVDEYASDDSDGT